MPQFKIIETDDKTDIKIPVTGAGMLAINHLKTFKVLDNEKEIAMLCCGIEPHKNRVVFLGGHAKYQKSNLAFFRFIRETTGKGRTPIQELSIRALRWGLSKKCSKCFAWVASRASIRSLERAIKQGVIDREGNIIREKIPQPANLEKPKTVSTMQTKLKKPNSGKRTPKPRRPKK